MLVYITTKTVPNTWEAGLPMDLCSVWISHCWLQPFTDTAYT